MSLVCPKCKHEIVDFLGCDECNHICMSYMAKNNLIPRFKPTLPQVCKHD